MNNYIDNTGFEEYSERIFSAYHYYSLSKKLNNTYRIAIRLIAPIDGKLLCDAVHSTMRRYPYLLLRRKNTFAETVLVYNPDPVVVKRGSDPIELGCDASNGHMLAFSYEGDVIYAHVFHGLLDGIGMSPVITTLLYYYCKEAFDPDLPHDGIRLAGEPIPPEEYIDPFPKKVPKDCKSLSKRRFFTKAFHVKSDKRVHPGEKRSCTVTVDEKELMSFCRLHDGSPAVLVSVVLCRAIAKLNPNAKKTVTAGIAMNLRPAFGAPLAHHSLTDILSLEFTEKLQKHSFEMQNTAFRSHVMLKADSETVLSNLRFASKTFTVAQKIPFLPIKRLLFGLAVPGQYGANTFMLSYVGKSFLGNVEKFVLSIRTDLDSPDIGIAVEINCLHGKFSIDMMTDFPEDLYVDAFCKELSSLGIACERGESRALLTPKCRY